MAVTTPGCITGCNENLRVNPVENGQNLLTPFGKTTRVSAMQQRDRNVSAAHCLLLAAAGIGMALLAVFAFFRFGDRRSHPQASAATGTPPDAAPARFTRTIVENFRLNGGPGAAHFPLITLGACRVVKPRIGGFRLGFGEVLELDRLELNLPLEFPAAGTNADTCVTPSTQTVNTLLSHSLDVSSFRRMARVISPVSAANVTGLRISLVHGTNRVAILAAASARIAGRADIALRNCQFLGSDLRQYKAAKASLTEDHGWQISAENGPTFKIESVVDAVRRMGPVSSKK